MADAASTVGRAGPRRDRAARRVRLRDRRAWTRSCCWATRWAWTGRASSRTRTPRSGADAAAGVRGRRRAARARRARRVHPRLPGVPRPRVRDRLARADPATRDGAARRRRAGRGRRAPDGRAAGPRRAGAAGRRRRHRDRRDRGRAAGGPAAPADGRPGAGASRSTCRPRRSSSPARTPSGHGVADRMVFVAADLLPYHVEPPYAVVCANLPYVPDGRSAAAVAGDRVRAARPRSTAGRTASTSCGGCSTALPQRHRARRRRAPRDRRGPGRRGRARGRGADPGRARAP